jgi:hypothetical protein
LGLDTQALTDLADTLQVARSAETGDGVWPENWPTVQAFLCVASQWRVVPIGGGLAPALPVYLGLDYTAARAGLELAGIAITPEIWRGLQVMEAEACNALNEADR